MHFMTDKSENRSKLMVYKKTEIPFSYPTYTNALAYADGYEVLKNANLPLFVLVTNGALAVELFLKSLAGKYVIEDELEEITSLGTKFRSGRSKQYVERDKGHNFTEIFESIPIKTQESLGLLWCSFVVDESLKLRLERLRYDFKNSRYCDKSGLIFNGSLSDYDELIRLFRGYEKNYK
ncbi:MAG: hypothetical protein ACI9T7_000043 [Oleiphilaceae bacterium]|jgi:hypothetical protein